MWVAVFHFLEREQAAVFFQPVDDDFIRFPHGFAGHAWHIRTETTVVHHRAINGQTVFQTDIVVVQTVRRRGVHHARTRIGGNVLTDDNRYDAV